MTNNQKKFMEQQAYLMAHEISSSLGMASSHARYLRKKMKPQDDVRGFEELERMLNNCKHSVAYFQRMMMGADYSSINVKAVSSIELIKHVEDAIQRNRCMIKIKIDQSSRPNNIFIDVNNFLFAISIIVNLCREDRLFSSRDYVNELTIVDSNKAFEIEFNLVDYSSTVGAGEKCRERLVKFEMLRDVCGSNNWKLVESENIRAGQIKKLTVKLHILQA